MKSFIYIICAILLGLPHFSALAADDCGESVPVQMQYRAQGTNLSKLYWDQFLVNTNPPLSPIAVYKSWQQKISITSSAYSTNLHDCRVNHTGRYETSQSYHVDPEGAKPSGTMRFDGCGEYTNTLSLTASSGMIDYLGISTALYGAPEESRHYWGTQNGDCATKPIYCDWFTTNVTITYSSGTSTTNTSEQGFDTQYLPVPIVLPEACTPNITATTNATSIHWIQTSECYDGADRNYSYTWEITITTNRYLETYDAVKVYSVYNTTSELWEIDEAEYHYTNQIDLLDEYTTGELLQRLAGSSAGNQWINGKGLAEYHLSPTERCGSISVMDYRFVLPETDANSVYRLEWEEVTRYAGGINPAPNMSADNRAARHWEVITGTGGEVAGQTHRAQIPLSPGWTSVENVTVTAMPREIPSGSVAGAGAPGSAGFGAGAGAGCASCGVGRQPPGSRYDAGVFFSIGMGQLGTGEDAGSILLVPPLPGSAADTNLVAYLVNTNMTRYSTADSRVSFAGGHDRTGFQAVYAPQATATLAQIGPGEVTISITPVGAGSPAFLWRVKNPNGDPTRILITKEVGGSTTASYEYTFSGTRAVFPSKESWQKDDKACWTLNANGEREETVCLEGSATRYETTTVKDADDNVVYSLLRRFTAFDWGEALTEETIGGVWTTSYTYPTVITTNLIGFTDHSTYTNYGGNVWRMLGSGRLPLCSVQWPDLSWEAYKYANGNKVAKRYMSFGDLAVPNVNDGGFAAQEQALTNACRLVLYQYGNTAPFADTPSTTEEWLQGRLIRKATADYQASGGGYTCTRRAYTNDSNGMTLTQYIQNGRVVRSSHPDGTLSLDTISGQTRTLAHGKPDAGGTAVADGTRREITYNVGGQVVLDESWDIATSALTSRKAWTNADEFLRPRLVTFLNGESASRTFACCGIDSLTDTEGVTTTFAYDALGRPYLSSRLGITTTRILDPMGRELRTIVTGTNSSSIQVWAGGYSTAGILITETNIWGGVTSHSWSTGSGRLVSTTTFPDTGQRQVSYYRDGAVSRISGSAVQPVRFEYGVEQQNVGGGQQQWQPFVNEICLAADGSDTAERTKTFNNWLGESSFVVANDTPTAAIARSHYNAAGQLSKQVDPDGVAVLFAYNARGELYRAALDVSGNDAMDLAGSDRIVEAITAVTNAHGTTVFQTLTKAWTTTGSSTPSIVATNESTADGMRSWSSRFGRTTATEVSSLVSGVRTVTTTFPDASQLIHTYRNGRLESAVRKTAASGTVVKSLLYEYNPFGLLGKVTDARDGSTTAVFDFAARTLTITAPAPAAGQSAQVTTHYFDTSGREVHTRLPDNSDAYTEFLPTGLTRKTYGSQTYPVEYAYDAQGRIKTLTTWQNYAGGQGAATTTWNYNQRGFLQSKLYQGNATGPSYTYTAGGRLKSRTSARSILTTYAYAFETPGTYGTSGDLVQIAYSGDPLSTPAVSLSFDRAGRVKTAGVSGGLSSTYLYSDADGLLSETFNSGDLAGITLTNNFDSLGRRSTNGAVLAGSWLTYSTYGYDSMSRLSVASLPLANVSGTYGYDLANSPLLSSLTLRQGANTRLSNSRQYDFLDRLTGTTFTPSGAGESSTLAAYAYNLLSQRTGMTNADNSFWSWQYDNLGQVTAGKRYWADQVPVAGQQFEYQFDDIGNRVSTKSGGDAFGQSLRTSTYTRNANLLNQYASRTVPRFADLMGEATNSALVTLNSQATYRHSNYFRAELAVTNTTPAWLSVTNLAVMQRGTNADLIATNRGNLFVAASSESFAYDADGNLTSDGRWSYSWDAENRLVAMQSLASGPDASKRQLTFAYDWQSRRTKLGVSTWTNSTWSVLTSNLFVNDAWNLIAELNATNHAVIRSYLWGSDLSGNMRGAGGVGGLLAVNDTAQGTHFYTYDGNGNVLGLVSAASGTTTAQYEYGPFGELLRATGPMALANPFRFSTKYQDDTTGLSYYGYRYYASALSMWLNRDPLGEAGGLNLYVFVKNSVPNLVDPLGRNPLLLILALFVLFESTANPPDAPPPIYDKLPLPVYSSTVAPQNPDTLSAPENGFSLRRADFLSGMGGAHFVGTYMEKPMADSTATLITAPLPFARAKCLSAAKTAPTKFPNLYPAETPLPYPRRELFFDGTKWRALSENGTTVTPNGLYNFVVQDGQTFISRGNFGRGGHLDLSRGLNVDYAGQIRFGHGNNAGQLRFWDNASGHFQPPAGFSHQAPLPPGSFQPFTP